MFWLVWLVWVSIVVFVCDRMFVDVNLIILDVMLVLWMWFLVVERFFVDMLRLLMVDLKWFCSVL